MRLITLVAMSLVGAGSSYAGGLDVHVLLSGQVAPGLYGQVNFGNERPPPVVYVQPMLIEPQEAPPPPIYLHVPPEHARNWRRHCGEYNACNRPVYFVRSQEYDPEYQRHYQDHERERELERQRWQERERDQERYRDRERYQERDRDHDRGHGRGHDGDERGQGHESHDQHDDN